MAHLRALALEGGLVAFKTGTEVEDMSFAEIALLRKLTEGIVPLYVKIGGPEARTDMRNCLAVGVDGVIAPMIESGFALQKFITSLREVAGSDAYARIRKGINIETKTALANLDEIFASEFAQELDQVTAARSDLSDSLSCHPDDPEVIGLCRRVVDYARYLDLETSIGGKIIPDTVGNLLQELDTDMINTRHMVLACPLIGAEPSAFVEKALGFEIALYRFFADRFLDRRRLHLERVRQLEMRLQKKPVLQN